MAATLIPASAEQPVGIEPPSAVEVLAPLETTQPPSIAVSSLAQVMEVGHQTMRAIIPERHTATSFLIGEAAGYMLLASKNVPQYPQQAANAGLRAARSIFSFIIPQRKVTPQAQTSRLDITEPLIPTPLT